MIDFDKSLEAVKTVISSVTDNYDDYDKNEFLRQLVAFCQDGVDMWESSSYC